MKGLINRMNVNETLDFIMTQYRINSVLLSELTKLHPATISRYRNGQRNIGKKSFCKIHEAFIQLDVNIKTIKEFGEVYENSRHKKVL